MSAKIPACGLVVLLAVVVSTALADEIWYGLPERYNGEAQQRSEDLRQVEEIEVAAGVKVRVDVWEDDYVPTYEDLVMVGFLPEDAARLRTATCTWGQIKLCFAGYHNDCCPKKNDEGGEG